MPIIAVTVAPVRDTIAAPGAKGCPVAIVFSSGFAALGLEGKVLERSLLATARTHRVATSVMRAAPRRSPRRGGLYRRPAPGAQPPDGVGGGRRGACDRGRLYAGHGLRLRRASLAHLVGARIALESCCRQTRFRPAQWAADGFGSHHNSPKQIEKHGLTPGLQRLQSIALQVVDLREEHLLPRGWPRLDRSNRVHEVGKLNELLRA
jgi:hypothetical protein